jgi:hypothetical protein
VNTLLATLCGPVLLGSLFVLPSLPVAVVLAVVLSAYLVS